MYAVIKTGGKQYRVEKDDIIEVELLDVNEGDAIKLEEVLMVGGKGAPKIGAPFITGANVSATVVKQKRGDKIIVFKKKRRQNYRRKNGHRQYLTVIKITDIAA